MNFLFQAGEAEFIAFDNLLSALSVPCAPGDTSSYIR